jgi:hypothetical protein
MGDIRPRLELKWVLFMELFGLLLFLGGSGGLSSG